MTTPPKLGSRAPSDLFEQLRLAWRFRGLDVLGVGDLTRLMTMSVQDIVDRFFESEQVKTVMALNGLIGTWAGPHEPGTGYVMAHHSIGDVGDGHLGSWATPIGGMGAVAAAIESSARSFGAQIRTEARVARIVTSSGRVYGAALETGEELLAPVVVYGWSGNLGLLREWYRTVTETTTPNLLVGENISFARAPQATPITRLTSVGMMISALTKEREYERPE